jgi:tetratricopeptide (TPR) repeat protein
MGNRDAGDRQTLGADPEREPRHERIREKPGEHLTAGNEVAGAVFGTVIQAGAIHGDIHIERPQVGASTGTAGAIKAPAAPAQLRAGPTYFAGRTDELTVLDRLLQEADDSSMPTLIAVSGAAGVGKTSLCLRWLHQIRDHYPDGQLYADLRGFTGTDPTPTGDVLEGFLRALGMAAEAVPASEDEQAATFRTLAAGRRLILMLDNAATAAQVRPLLPGTGPTVVVITSRLRLTGLALDGAHFVELGPLSEDGGLVLLRRMLGSERVCAEVEAAQTLVALCARLPLAICASGARLATRRHLSIARVVRDLTDEAHRLAVLGKHTDVSVQAAFDVSYAALPPEVARLYRLLGLHPGSEFDVGAAAAIADTDDDEAGELLDCLLDASLIEERSAGRYAFHDLLRLHARATSEVELEHERRTALDRLARWYLRMAVCADRTVIRGRWHLGDYYESDDGAPTDFDSSASALDWLESECDNLATLVDVLHRDGSHEISWQICEAMWSLFIYRKHFRYWLRTHRSGIAAARDCQNPLAEARMLEGLAMAHLNLQDFEAAAVCCTRALELERENDHLDGQATTLEYLGIVELGRERPDRAVELFRQAQQIHERIGGTRGVALMNRRLGEALRNVGDYGAAITHLDHARRYFADKADAYNLARTLTGLGQVYMLGNRPAEAGEVLGEALRISAEIGAREQEGKISSELARFAARTGDHAAQRRHLERAHAIYLALDAPQAENVGKSLAQLTRAAGEDQRTV